MPRATYVSSSSSRNGYCSSYPSHYVEQAHKGQIPFFKGGSHWLGSSGGKQKTIQSLFSVQKYKRRASDRILGPVVQN